MMVHLQSYSGIARTEKQSKLIGEGRAKRFGTALKRLQRIDFASEVVSRVLLSV